MLRVTVHAQDTTFLNRQFDTIPSRENARYFIIDQNLGQGQKLSTTYFISGQKYLEQNIDLDKNLKHGPYREWDAKGNLRVIKNYYLDSLDRVLMTYYANGALKRSDTFKVGKFISGRCFDSLGNEVSHVQYLIFPEFKGGYTELYKYLTKNLRYPKYCRKHKIEGKIIVNFIVNKNGDVSFLRLRKSAHQDLNEEAIRVIMNMPKWQPGSVDGEPAPIHYNLPITFKVD